MTLYDKVVKAQIWDTAGQEQYESITKKSYASITKPYHRGQAGAICVFDVTSRSSLDEIPKWFDEITNHWTIIMLIGNKTDKDNREVSETEAQAYANELGILYAETSALTGEGIQEAFTRLLTNILELKEPDLCTHATGYVLK
jgi:small GTP-binding protein